MTSDISADPSFRERILREADLASTLWNPHFVGVHDRGEHEGQLWISMDFVDGEDAGSLLARKYPAGMPQELVTAIVTWRVLPANHQSCPSLRQADDEGDPIYAVYRLAGTTQSAVCAAVRAAGGGAYGKWLHYSTDPGYFMTC